MNQFENLTEETATVETPEFFDQDLKINHGLCSDPFNEWILAANGHHDLPQEPLLTYEDRVKKIYNPAQAEYVLAHSDPEHIKMFNDLVALFNQEQSEILAHSDHHRAQEIAMQALALIGRK